MADIEHDGCDECIYYECDDHEFPCNECTGTALLGSPEYERRKDHFAREKMKHKKMMKCKVCEFEFEPKKENKIIVKDVNFMTKEMALWDAFECPECGCQNIASKHLERGKVQ